MNGRRFLQEIVDNKPILQKPNPNFPDDLSQLNSMLQNSIQTSINDASTNLSNKCEMRRDEL
jgi:hypothetical protein